MKDYCARIRNADCAIIVTEWDEFKKLRPEDFVNNMKNPAVIDGRRICDPEVFCRRVKFAATGLGEQGRISMPVKTKKVL
jgi:UDP-N-acetyl-D-mannosaminuronate dehydrogenase